MFKELFGGIELPVREEPEKLHIEMPTNVMVRIKLEPEDLSHPEKMYQTMWNLFFLDTLWYAKEENRKKVAEMIPCYVVAKINRCPFLPGYFTNPETYEQIKTLIETNLVLFPITQIKKNNRMKMMGFNYNMYDNHVTDFHLEYTQIYVVDKVVFGKFSEKDNRILMDSNLRRERETLKDLLGQVSAGEEL